MRTADIRERSNISNWIQYVEKMKGTVEDYLLKFRGALTYKRMVVPLKGIGKSRIII